MRSTPDVIPKLVSVIIPTYNRATLIRQSIQSALSQDYPHCEVIVIDDGSTDHTAARLKQFPNVQYFCQGNAGPSAARNYGLSKARGEFIAYLDSDDLWQPKYLSTCLDGLQLTGAGFVFANWQGILEDNSLNYPDYFEKRGTLRNFETGKTGSWFTLQPEQARELFLTTSTALPSGTVIRRTAISSLWDEQARVGEDRLFLLDIIIDSKSPIAFTKQVLWSHRLHSANAYTGNPEIPKIAQQEIYSKQAILDRYRHLLSAKQEQLLYFSISDNYFDWAYYESQQRRRKHAIQLYWKSLRLRPRSKTVLAMLKASMIPPFRRSRP